MSAAKGVGIILIGSNINTLKWGGKRRSRDKAQRVQYNKHGMFGIYFA